MSSQRLYLAVAALVLAGIAGLVWTLTRDRTASPPKQPEPTSRLDNPDQEIRSDSAGAREPVSVTSIAETTQPRPQDGTDIPKWIRQLAYDIGIKPDLILDRVKGKPDVLEELRRVYGELTAGLSQVVSARSDCVARISANRQKIGQFEVFASGQRLPDPDPRFKEYIAYGHEPDPGGGPDRVRIIRILPGEDPELDRAREQVEAMQANMREVILDFLDLKGGK